VERAAKRQLFLFLTLSAHHYPVKFSAKLDLSAWLTTLFVFLVLVTVSYFIFSAVPAEAPSWQKWLTYPVSTLPLLLFVVIFLYGPVSYEISDGKFRVHRRLSDIAIEIKDIVAVDYLSDSFLQDIERTGGNGGVFGYFGEFTAGRDLYHLYCTRMKGTVLITTKDRRLIVSPEDIRLVKELRGMIESSSSA
jgi:hypothetical protein